MEKTCVKVPKLYDWVAKESTFHTCISLDTCCTISNQISEDFTLNGSSAPQLLWKIREETATTAGTLTVFFSEGSSDVLDVFVNGTFSFFVPKGKVRSMTLDSFHSIEISCPNDDDVCSGSFSLSIHEKQVRALIPDPESVTCYLANCDDTRLAPCCNEIQCTEVSHVRKDQVVIMPTGDVASLQRIFLSKTGCIAVSYKIDGKLYKRIVPFYFREQLLLCAPNGTRVECDITHVECIPTVTIYDDGSFINLSITICQNIKSTADITFSLKSNLCHPRQEPSRQPLYL
ncbi:S-Ena type endospore appendage [Metabacillus iocasae]|uniref:Endospore appendages core domain-containing protein n=1 Tax=Priestia iocasae TaxID=2291674 RepID=A0ABS2QW23_9BACI|nr:S-Ena type endospore appendage [Metabacillus iocasae]MBM7702946.1 hypothetical protein [Metabacillus iocasae]